MKKILSILFVISVILSMCCVLTSCGKEPTFEENIVGTWESQKDGSKNKVTLVFEYKDDTLRGTQSYYDYDNSEWGEYTFKVGDVTKYTMTLLFDGGKIDTVSYSMGKDTLIFDNMVYKNDTKDIKIDDTEITYILDGIPMPVRAGIYFGMSKAEVKMLADTDFIKTTDTDTLVYELPDYFYPKVEGDTWYAFENEKLIKTGFDFNAYLNTDKEIEDLTNNIIAAYTKQYGNYFTYKWTTSDTISYMWETGNMSIEFVVFDNGGLRLYYSMEDLGYKKVGNN